MLIKRVRAGTECAIKEEQCGFRQGRAYNQVDQVFTCVKSISKIGKMYSGRLWIWKRHMIRSIAMVWGRC